MQARRGSASEFRPDHPHLRSERGWELCDDPAPCPHAVAARCRRHYCRVVAIITGGMVVFPTACACFIDTSPAWVAGTFTVSSVFAGVAYAGLCAESDPSGSADRDGET
jgi:hypothetical protein